VCGLEATQVQIEGKPRIEIDAGKFEEICVGQIAEPEPFRCTYMLAAAIDAGVVERDGTWRESVPT